MGARIAAIVLGFVASAVLERVLAAGWKAATGQEPPKKNDADVNWRSALIWAAVSSAAMAVLKLLLERNAQALQQRSAERKAAMPAVELPPLEPREYRRARRWKRG